MCLAMSKLVPAPAAAHSLLFVGLAVAASALCFSTRTRDGLVKKLLADAMCVMTTKALPLIWRN